MDNKIVTIGYLKTIDGKGPLAGKRVVLTNGCFDILHVGHIRYLKASKSLGDILVVAINSDSSVKQIKGEKRPILPWEERAELVASLQWVDYVVPIVDTTADYVIELLRPTIYVKGADCKNISNTKEAIAARSINAIVCSIPSDIDRSTTDIVQRILLNYANG